MNAAGSEAQQTSTLKLRAPTRDASRISFVKCFVRLGLKIGLLAGALKIGFVENRFKEINRHNRCELLRKQA
jgi:hypothetical protein